MSTMVMRRKSSQEKFVSRDTVLEMLQAIEASDDPDKKQMHALIFFGFFLALRSGEYALLKEEHFSGVDRQIVVVPRLKKTKRIRFRCTKCGGSLAVSVKRAGKEYPCRHCVKFTKVPMRVASDDKSNLRQLPFLETHAAQYMDKYVEGLPKGQKHLFVFRNKPISWDRVCVLFKRAAHMVGLSPVYTPHSLRHGRGKYLYEKFKDIRIVADFLGHEHVETSYIYVSWSEEDKYRNELEQDAFASVPL